MAHVSPNYLFGSFAGNLFLLFTTGVIPSQILLFAVNNAGGVRGGREIRVKNKENTLPNKRGGNGITSNQVSAVYMGVYFSLPQPEVLRIVLEPSLLSVITTSESESEQLLIK